MPPLRASDRFRAGTVARLRRGYLDGQLSTDTFESRMAIALAARRRGTLRALLADLRRRTQLQDALASLWHGRLAAAERAAAAAELVPARASDAPPQATLLLGRTALTEITVGRASAATLTFGTAGVSRHHARFERVAGRWHVVDLASTNGTFVDGVRVERAPVQAGAVVRLGDAYILIG